MNLNVRTGGFNMNVNMGMGQQGMGQQGMGQQGMGQQGMGGKSIF
jgi:hypothetical protein